MKTPVKISEIRRISLQILQKCGVPAEDSRTIADSLIYANRRGKETHGVVRLPKYVNQIERGLISPRTTVSVVKDGPATAVLDARNGFGQVAGIRGMQMCIEKAGKYGIGLVGIRNSTNFGTAGYLAEKASAKKMIGFVMSNSAPAIAPTGGKVPLFGTNPFSIAFPPAGREAPIVLDMATSAAARGKVRMAAREGGKIPFGWALDCEGMPTNDPHEALKGSMMPSGGHKGYGMALSIDILAGLLTGSAFGGGTKPLSSPDGYSGYGHILAALDSCFFMPFEDYCEKIKLLKNNVKRCANGGSVHLPGERSYEKTLENRYVIDLPRDQFEEINSLAGSIGLSCRMKAHTHGVGSPEPVLLKPPPCRLE